MISIVALKIRLFLVIHLFLIFGFSNINLFMSTLVCVEVMYATFLSVVNYFSTALPNQFTPDSINYPCYHCRLQSDIILSNGLENLPQHLSRAVSIWFVVHKFKNLKLVILLKSWCNFCSFTIYQIKVSAI